MIIRKYNVLNFIEKNKNYIPVGGYFCKNVKLINTFKVNADHEVIDSSHIDYSTAMEYGVFFMENESVKSIQLPLYLFEGYYNFAVLKHNEQVNIFNPIFEINTDNFLADYTAYFLRWTLRLGVGYFQCSDGKVRILNTKLLKNKVINGNWVGVPRNISLTDIPAYHPWFNLPPQRRNVNGKHK